MKKDFDPALKAAMKEIKGVIARYNCGGYVQLTSRTHGEFELVQPTWSMYRDVRDNAGHMKLYLKSNREDTEATMHFLMGTMSGCGEMFLKLDQLKSQLEKHCEIDHRFEPVRTP